MKETIVPIALISQNDISTEPQIWFSCGKKLSNYYVKDAAGATSAAPTYFPPKYTKAMQNLQANCDESGLVNIDGECYHKSVDGGLFANSPTLLSLFLWKEIILGKTLEDCVPNYGGIFNISNSTKGFSLQFNYKNGGYAPRLTLDDDLDVTIVNVGTGYQDIIEEPMGLPSLLKGISGVLVGFSTLSLAYFALHDCYSSCNSHHKAIRSTTVLADNTMKSLTNCFSYTFCGNDIFSTGLKVIGAFFKYLVPTSLIAIGSLLHYKTSNAEDGLLSALDEKLIDKILKVNEKNDVLIARDVFSTINLNPIFNEKIELDSSDEASMKLMKTVTEEYLAANSEAFANVSSCLSELSEKTDECDYVMQHFYDMFRDDISRGIDLLSYKGD